MENHTNEISLNGGDDYQRTRAKVRELVAETVKNYAFTNDGGKVFPGKDFKGFYEKIIRSAVDRLKSRCTSDYVRCQLSDFEFPIKGGLIAGHYCIDFELVHGGTIIMSYKAWDDDVNDTVVYKDNMGELTPVGTITYDNHFIAQKVKEIYERDNRGRMGLAIQL